LAQLFLKQVTEVQMLQLTPYVGLIVTDRGISV